MKQKYIWGIIIVIMVAISILLCFSMINRNQRIDFYNAKDFKKETDTPFLSIRQHKIVNEITTILKETYEMPGFMDAGSAVYIMEINRFYEDAVTVNLYLLEEEDRGWYTFSNRTEIGYLMTEANTKKLKKIISNRSKQ